MYPKGRRSALWQLGKKRAVGGREAGIAQWFIAALRQVGLIGEPVWTKAGAVLHYQRGSSSHAGVPVKLSGVWFNWLRVVSPETPTQMNLVPKGVRNQAKETIARSPSGSLTRGSRQLTVSD